LAQTIVIASLSLSDFEKGQRKGQQFHGLARAYCSDNSITAARLPVLNA
jgi:hypothetical protein